MYGRTGQAWERESCNPIRPAHTKTSDPVLIVLHQRTSSAGAVGHWLRSNGYHLDIRRPMQGEALPDALTGHSGVIVFGGPMSANDGDNGMRSEIDWLAVPLRDDVPYLGICLGAQMMVRQLGGRVADRGEEIVEVGYHDIQPTEIGKALFNWPDRCFQWHREGFDIPSGAEQLAAGYEFENQAYRYGRAAFGVQFHPEITEMIIRRWSVRGAHMLIKKGAHQPERLLQDHLKYGEAQRQWLHQFMDHWTDLMPPSA